MTCCGGAGICAYVLGMGRLACVLLASGVLLGVLSLVALTGARQE